MDDQLAGQDARERGREAYGSYAWATAFEQLSTADRHQPLDLDDLERLVIAAHLLGRDEDAIRLLTRAQQHALDLGEVARAIRAIFWLALELIPRGQTAQAGGWLTRANRLLETQPEIVERGYLLVLDALRSLEVADFATARATFDEVAAIAARFRDPDLATLARLGQGEALIGLAETERGIAFLDEAMVAVTADEVSPPVVGIVYCSVIEQCQRLFDLRRAQEWTAALTRWTESQPDLVPYRGQCLLYRAELMALHGAWQESLDEARRAYTRLVRPAGEPAAGAAIYQQAELHRLRGEFAEADAAYRQASRDGRRPEPGLALLRLAQGRIQAASASIQRSLDEAHDPAIRPRLLEANVEIALAAGDTESARVAADELREVADRSGAPQLRAMAARASGAVSLAQDDGPAALGFLRRAWALWQELDAPYEAARARVLIGHACRAVGDEDSARMELAAARAVFERLGATPDLERIDSVTGGTLARASSGLTARELEVLRLVAAGKTNRAIAGALFISEKTVARHLSNIFTKLSLSSRSAATAWAYEHGLQATTP